MEIIRFYITIVRCHCSLAMSTFGIFLHNFFLSFPLPPSCHERVLFIIKKQLEKPLETHLSEIQTKDHRVFLTTKPTFVGNTGEDRPYKPCKGTPLVTTRLYAGARQLFQLDDNVGKHQWPIWMDVSIQPEPSKKIQKHQTLEKSRTANVGPMAQGINATLNLAKRRCKQTGHVGLIQMTNPGVP